MLWKGKFCFKVIEEGEFKLPTAEYKSLLFWVFSLPRPLTCLPGPMMILCCKSYCSPTHHAPPTLQTFLHMWFLSLECLLFSSLLDKVLLILLRPWVSRYVPRRVASAPPGAAWAADAQPPSRPAAWEGAMGQGGCHSSSALEEGQHWHRSSSLTPSS